MFLRVCPIQVMFAGPIGSQALVSTARRNATSYASFHRNLWQRTKSVAPASQLACRSEARDNTSLECTSAESFALLLRLALEGAVKFALCRVVVKGSMETPCLESSFKMNNAPKEGCHSYLYPKFLSCFSGGDCPAFFLLDFGVFTHKPHFHVTSLKLFCAFETSVQHTSLECC